jgi:hypothetical protein
MTISWLVQSHPCHQVRFNNPARRTDSPTGIAETKKKIIKTWHNQNQNKNIRNTKIYVQNKYSRIKISTSAKKQIALKYARLKRDTSRYQERKQTKFKYPTETTFNAAEIPRQMPLFIKTISDNKLPEK